MARYIDAEALMQKLSRMIDYCEKDHKVNALNALFQVGDAIMDCPTADVVPKRDYDTLKSLITHKEDEAYNKGYADAASEIFAEIEKFKFTILKYHKVVSIEDIEELKKKYTEGEKNEDAPKM